MSLFNTFISPLSLHFFLFFFLFPHISLLFACCYQRLFLDHFLDVQINDLALFLLHEFSSYVCYGVIWGLKALPLHSLEREAGGEGCEGLKEVTEDEGGTMVLRCGLGVDNYYVGTISSSKHGKRGGRLNSEGRA